MPLPEPIASYLTPGTTVFDYVVMPAIIFVARATDTSLGTLRLVFLSKGQHRAMRIVGFFEVLIWITAASQLLQNLTSWVCYLAWAGGFSMGGIIGFKIERKLAIGQQLMRIISDRPVDAFLKALSEHKQGYTVLDGSGAKGPVKMIFVAMNRQDIPVINALIEQYLPGVFHTIDDIQTGSGYFHSKRSGLGLNGFMWPLRKGK